MNTEKKNEQLTVKKPVAKKHQLTTSANPEGLLKLAIESNADIDKLEKLMGLHERWQAQEAKKEFLQAMASFQAECPIIAKKSSVSYKHKDGGGSTSYSYSNLSEIAKTIKPALKKNGLSYKWRPETNEGKIIVRCVVSHIGGHSEVSEPMTAAADNSGKKNLIQQTGSTITYLQRYTLIGALGISTAEEDNDGQGTTEPSQANNETVSDEVRKVIQGAKTVKVLDDYVRACDHLHQNTEFKQLVLNQRKALKNDGARSKNSNQETSFELQ